MSSARYASPTGSPRCSPPPATPASSSWPPAGCTRNRCRSGIRSIAAVWLATTTPAPLSGHFWHDRRIRDEHYLRHTRNTEGNLLSLWEYCLDAAGVPLHPH
ncbi:hypothetical protein NLM24_17550 [Nocardia zapadnayensis]|uniref:hypothetical protein n=1 Tax=Nocardia rhamnosiphila TaxID=426716 RepID=UPI002245DE8A|nr:hypothetical protein [Nocardia zapadnayensis]MCX0272474.1 hypothetical protein [Nocardia zapadnayensis]